jgi:ABC transport permease subunit
MARQFKVRTNERPRISSSGEPERSASGTAAGTSGCSTASSSGSAAWASFPGGFSGRGDAAYEWRELIRQLDEVGSKSLPLVAMAGAAIGVIISLEARYSLSRFGAKSMFPATLVYSVIQVMGPVITGLVVSGRVGAGIGAELASMKVTEQIDAIEASAINPYRLLAATRILACILMLPLLTLAADACGLADGLVCTGSG